MASGVSSSVVGTVGAVSDGVDAVAYGVSGGEIWFFGGKNTFFKTKHLPGIKAVGNGVSGGIKAVGKGWYNISFQMIISCTNVPPLSRRIEFLIKNRIYFHFPGVSGGIQAVNDGVVGTIDGVKHGVTGGISRWAF